MVSLPVPFNIKNIPGIDLYFLLVHPCSISTGNILDTNMP